MKLKEAMLYAFRRYYGLLNLAETYGEIEITISAEENSKIRKAVQCLDNANFRDFAGKDPEIIKACLWFYNHYKVHYKVLLD